MNSQTCVHNKPLTDPCGECLLHATNSARRLLKDVYSGWPIETDPFGKPAHEPGAKLDHGKNRVGMVLLAFANALSEVSAVGTYGANKYTDGGWITVPDGKARYTDAMLRHLLEEARGELLDKDSGLHHAAHTAWNALARLELLLREQEGE